MKEILTTLACLALALPSFAAEEKPKLDFSGPLFGGLLSPVEAQEGSDFHVGLVHLRPLAEGLRYGVLEIPGVSRHPQRRRRSPLPLPGQEGRLPLRPHRARRHSEGPAVLRGGSRARRWKFEIDYTGIPHGFGNSGKSILEPVSETDWRLSDTLQQSFQDQVAALPSNLRTYPFLAAIVAPTLADKPPAIDIALQRNRTNLAFSLLPGGKNFDIGVTYFHERRSGDRTNHGTSFGFSNVVETADPIRYITQDFGLNATAKGNWGTAFAAMHLNDFSNRFETFSFDNPWRAVDSTDPSAYQAPGSASINGPKSGLLALPPSNKAWNVSGGTTLKFGPRTRLTADLQFGQWTQNETAFIPYHHQHRDRHSLRRERRRRGSSRQRSRRKDRRLRPQRVLHDPGHRRPSG